MNVSRPFAYPFVDYWAVDELTSRRGRADVKIPRPKLLGVEPAIDADVQAADRIIAQAPTTSPLDVFTYFADLTAVGSTGEAFNSRWMYYENPIIVWFFHATGTKPLGDCTSWCAAFLSWTLDRCGLRSEQTASSQAYTGYGLPVSAPVAGDIVVFQSLQDRLHGHVALFLEERNDRIRIIGGNQSAGVQIPGCPPGFGVTRIGREWREKVDLYQRVIAFRRAISV